MSSAVLDRDGEGSKNRTKLDRELLLKKEVVDSPVSGYVRYTQPYGRTKLEAVRGYLWSYSVILNKAPGGRPFAYVDGMAGPGILRFGTKEGRLQRRLMEVDPISQFTLGSPLLALSNHPHYPIVTFIEKRRDPFRALSARVDAYFPGRATVVRGDANVLVPRVAHELGANTRALIFLDPEGLELEMRTIIALKANCPHAELLVLYPFDMAVARCLNHKGSEATLTRFFGDGEFDSDSRTWETLAAVSRLGGDIRDQQREAFLEFYSDRILRCGFNFVAPSTVIKSGHGVPLYQLLFAGTKETAAKIMKDILAKSERRPVEPGTHRKFSRPTLGQFDSSEPRPTA